MSNYPLDFLGGLEGLKSIRNGIKIMLKLYLHI